MEFAVGHHFFECYAGDVGVGGLGFVYGDTGHARRHGLAGVTVEAGAGGDGYAVYAEAGALGVALFAGVFVLADVDGLGFELRAGQGTAGASGFGERLDAAAAAVIERRIHGVPNGVGGFIYPAVHQAVAVAGALVVDGDVSPIGVGVEAVHHLYIAAGHVVGLGVGEVDGF